MFEHHDSIDLREKLQKIRSKKEGQFCARRVGGCFRGQLTEVSYFLFPEGSSFILFWDPQFRGSHFIFKIPVGFPFIFITLSSLFDPLFIDELNREILPLTRFHCALRRVTRGRIGPSQRVTSRRYYLYPVNRSGWSAREGETPPTENPTRSVARAEG